MCALGELCTMGRKFRSKPPQIGAFCVFGCILGMKYLHNSVNPEYLPECTQAFFPTTRGVPWMAPAGPQTTHRATASQIRFKSRPPARTSRGAPPAKSFRPHQNDHTGFWGPGGGPAGSRRGGGGDQNSLEPTPDAPRHECYRIPLKKVAPPCSVQAAPA